MNQRRLDAANRGDKTYEGGPCRTCGSTERYVSSGACRACAVQRSKWEGLKLKEARRAAKAEREAE